MLLKFPFRCSLLLIATPLFMFLTVLSIAFLAYIPTQKLKSMHAFHRATITHKGSALCLRKGMAVKFPRRYPED